MAAAALCAQAVGGAQRVARARAAAQPPAPLRPKPVPPPVRVWRSQSSLGARTRFLRSGAGEVDAAAAAKLQLRGAGYANLRSQRRARREELPLLAAPAAAAAAARPFQRTLCGRTLFCRRRHKIARARTRRSLRTLGLCLGLRVRKKTCNTCQTAALCCERRNCVQLHERRATPTSRTNSAK